MVGITKDYKEKIRKLTEEIVFLETKAETFDRRIKKKRAELVGVNAEYAAYIQE